MKQKVINEILANRIIVIVRGVASEQLIPMTEALYAGGIRLMELTYSADGSRPDEAVAEDIRRLCAHFGDRMIIGAGTVLKESQVELTYRAGGRFIISPDTYEPVIRKSVELGMVSIPGALTPSEAQSAHRAGADFVKLFPITDLGCSYLKAICAPLSHIRFLAVGGMNEDNLTDYLAAGALGVGVGGNIIDKTCLANRDFDGIRRRALRYTERIKQWQTI